MMRIAVCFLVVLTLFAQTSRSFEVVSVKPHEGPLRSIGDSTAGQRFNSINTAAGLILFGWHLRNYQLIRTPPLLTLGDTFYDVTAKADGDAVPSNDEFRQMVRALLAERFGLKVHTEMQEIPVYQLVVGKNGLKMKESAAEAGGRSGVKVSGRNYVATMPKASMEDVLRFIENSFPDRPVLDRTGLTGSYDVTLTFTPDIPSNRNDPDAADLSIFTAVQEQLGLKLEPRKAMVEVLIVDSVVKPSAN